MRWHILALVEGGPLLETQAERWEDAMSFVLAVAQGRPVVALRASRQRTGRGLP